MKKYLQALLFLFVAFGIFAFDTNSPAFAATTPPKTHHAQVKHKTNAHAELRTAQTHLIHLGYLTGKADGMMGPKTKAALSHFQRDQGFKVTGALTAETLKALAKADKPHAVPEHMTMTSRSPNQFYTTHPDFYGHVDQQYADPMLLGRGGMHGSSSMQVLPSRFASVTVTEDATTAMKRYNITVGSQPVLQIDNQPSVIGISRTYHVGSEDAIIFTAYNGDNKVCSTRHYLLTLRTGTSHVQAIGNCTAAYQAGVYDKSLIITFPESDDRRAVAATWFYDDGALEKL